MGPLFEQARAVEEMHMRQARTLEDSGIADRVITYISAKMEGDEKERSLRSGLPLVTESCDAAVSVLYAGVRFLDDDDAPTTLVPVGMKRIDQLGYEPYGALQLDESDLLIVEGLCDEAKLTKAATAPNYSTEFGMLNEQA